MSHKKYMAVLLITAVIAGNAAFPVEAAGNDRPYGWTKQAIGEGTTVDARYLWPDEPDPSFTAVYRDGKRMEDDSMYTLTSGSIYHFRGTSNGSSLYAQVYVGRASRVDGASGDVSIWYGLLPSQVRDGFEGNGWTWTAIPGQEERAMLDHENHRILVRDDDPQAILYGVGLYLDAMYGYADDAAFTQEGNDFETIFGHADNLFASALECYHVRGGELRSRCPKVYAMVAEAMSQLDGNTKRIREETLAGVPATGMLTDIPAGDGSGPTLLTGLLDHVNGERTRAGLDPVARDSADDGCIMSRMETYLGQQDDDGSTYTDAVKCEIFLENVYSVQDVYSCAEGYFLMEDMKAFNCVMQDGYGILVLVW